MTVKRNDNRQAQKPTTNKIHRDTNLTRKTDAKTGYKHGSVSSRQTGKR